MQFRNVDHALRFAFAMIDKHPVKIQEYNKRSSNITGEKLSPLDMHAQAAIIISTVDHQLPEIERLFVYALYHHHPIVQKTAAHYLADMHLRPQLKIDTQLLYTLTVRHFARNRPSKSAVARQHKVRLNTVQYWEKKIGCLLTDVWFRADAILDCYFADTGLIEERYTA